MSDRDPTSELKRLTRELDNFQDIARYILPQPGEVPRLKGIDVWGGMMPLAPARSAATTSRTSTSSTASTCRARIARARGEGKADVASNLARCEQMAGIALIDVSGHRMTDALLAAMLHQAFLLGAIYELDTFGQITKRLFENLNTRFYQSSGAHKFISMIYGEIAEDARFRFLSAGQPFPRCSRAATSASWK